MKQQYIEPKSRVLELESRQMICQSFDPKDFTEIWIINDFEEI